MSVATIDFVNPAMGNREPDNQESTVILILGSGLNANSSCRTR